jgi:lysophospholipase L1-like esterase
MSRLRLTKVTSLSTASFGLAALCLWVTACSPAQNVDPDGSGTGGRETGGAAPGIGGLPAGGDGGRTSGTGGAEAGDTGGSTSGSSGGDFGTTGGAGASMGGAGSSSGGSEGTVGGGGGGVPVTPVPLDPALLSRCTGSKPIRCTFPVPADGNYNVTVELGSAQAASTSQIEAELARLVVPTVKLAAGAYSQQTFSVNVHNETHDDYTAPDKQLDVLISGEAPALHGIGYAPVNIPTLFVVGDSTVCDWAPDRANRGWAQPFTAFLKPGLAVANYADSGDTASSLYSKFTSRGAVIKKGDYLFIQFGHNDQKSTSGVANYKANVMKYITDARNAMATPILFSPVARRAYLDNQNKAVTLEDPGFNGLDQQARDLAAAENVAFVDLTTLAIKYYATVNAASLMNDIAHFNAAGATAISKLVADALKAGTTPMTSISDFVR